MMVVMVVGVVHLCQQDGEYTAQGQYWSPVPPAMAVGDCCRQSPVQLAQHPRQLQVDNVWLG